MDLGDCSGCDRSVVSLGPNGGNLVPAFCEDEERPISSVDSSRQSNSQVGIASGTNSKNINNLPFECLYHILSLLEDRNLTFLSCVCKLWHSICNLSWARKTEINCLTWYVQPRISSFALLLQKCNPSMIRSASLIDEDYVNDRLTLLAAMGFCNLKELNLNNCSQLNQSGIVNITCMTQLEKLSLHRCNRLSSNSLSYLRECRSLTYLDIGLVVKADDQYLSFLTHLTNLKVLGISRCKHISSVGMERNLTCLTNLESLDLTSCCVGQPSPMCFLLPLTKLRVLGLARCSYITNLSLKSLEHLFNLTNLDIRSAKITNVGMSSLQKLTNLTTLYMKRCSYITSHGLQYLSRLTNLKTLILSKCNRIEGRGLNVLSTLVKMEHFDISGCLLNDENLEFLSSFTALKILKLSDCYKINGSYLRYLMLLKDLKELQMGHCVGMLGSNISHLSVLTNLRNLNLERCMKIDDESLCHLRNLRNLKVLILHECMQLTDEGVRNLTMLTQLKFLDLGKCPNLTDFSLQYLSENCNLSILCIMNNGKITVDGIGKMSNVTLSQ